MKDYKALNWSKTYGMKQLLNDVSFLIREGQHVGLVGANGSGKTTLLNIIAGKSSLDQGQIEHPKDFTVGIVTQDPELDESQTIFEAVYHSESPIVQLVGRYEEVTLDLQLDSENSQLQKKFQQIEQEMNAQNAWTLDTTIQTILSKLGIHDLTQEVKVLSGGQRKRVGLAKVLIEEPDLLLMDEPTNHLDFEMVEWLENYIANYKKSVLVVTHDRYFLDQITTHIFALDRGDLKQYEGNYQIYLEKLQSEHEIEAATMAKQKKLYKSELAWMRKGAKARTTKQQARIHRFENLKEKVSQTPDDSELTVDLDTQRLGNKVLEFDNLTVGYPNKPLITNINLLLQNKERIGIIGDNGAGKTTFLNTIAGIQAPLSGEVKTGETVRIAYFQQIPTDLPEDKRVINYVQEIASEYVYDDGTQASAAQMLEQFLFPRESHGMLIGTLSGGERKRLYLLKILMTRPNVLLLDEPTNDLDIDTLSVLEDYLETFQGTVITVSHDRYFLDKVVEKLIIVDSLNNTVQLFYGNYHDYRDAMKEAKNQASQSQKVASQSEQNKQAAEPVTEETPKAKRMSWQEKKDWAVIESEIEQLEMDIEAIDQAMNENGNDYSKLSELQLEKDSKENDLLEKMTYWEYLSTLEM
ncbi:ABC-F family ATP-binding cassette domain-containing protein [Aerococcus viridans]|uniref:ABC-F family ATP-binding cassette domain-containing protein n=1 Tax=Aerococcus TaxID=1375 RepID=UPI0025C28444|nr:MULTISPECIES: ABC-F family ATP-binding cassette domain-containing protein [unclassified Aerococcus]GMR69838.1 ABC-F family ATP-binding cassette domain-containing protein [Aerococcus viridans]